MPQVCLSVRRGEEAPTPYLPIVLKPQPPDTRTVAQLFPSEILMVAQDQVAFKKALASADVFSTPLYFMGTAEPPLLAVGDRVMKPRDTSEGLSGVGEAAAVEAVYLRAVIPSATSSSSASPAPAPGESPQLPPA